MRRLARPQTRAFLFRFRMTHWTRPRKAYITHISVRVSHLVKQVATMASASPARGGAAAAATAAAAAPSATAGKVPVTVLTGCVLHAAVIAVSTHYSSIAIAWCAHAHGRVAPCACDDVCRIRRIKATCLQNSTHNKRVHAPLLVFSLQVSRLWQDHAGELHPDPAARQEDRCNRE